MSGAIGKPERVTQERVIERFTQKLGDLYLGDWSAHKGNHGIKAFTTASRSSQTPKLGD